MKKVIYIIYLLANAFIYSCDYPHPTSTNITPKENVVEPKDRDAAYYASKGFQIFPQYHLAVKCPVILKDISNQSKANFDFHFGGVENNSTFYEIIVINFPLGYNDLSDEEKLKFEDKFLSENFSGKTVVTEMAGKKIDATVMEYTHKQGQGKGIAFILEGKTFAFNIITNDNLTERFNTLTNNIIFYSESSNQGKTISSLQSKNEKKEVSDEKSKTIVIPGSQIDQRNPLPTNPPSTLLKAPKNLANNTSSSKKTTKVQCTNCSDFDIEFRNYQWDQAWEYDFPEAKLESFNVVNRSENIIDEIKVKWTVYDPDGTPVNSGADPLNLGLKSIEPNSGKICYGIGSSSVSKKKNQTLKITITSVKIE